MASKSVLELAVGTGQWDSGLKKAKQALDNFTQANGGLQSALNKDSQSMQQFVKMMGQMDSTAKTSKGQMNDYKSTIEQLTMQYNRMTDAQKKTIGQDYLHAIDQMKQKYQGVAEEVQKINQSLKSMPEPAAMSGGGLFGGGQMSGMLQVFGGNVMTKLAGAGIGFVTEMGDMVKQGIELARAGEGIRIAFERLGRGDILDGLRKATHGTVTDLELMKAAVKFNDFKLPLDELGTMLAFAQQKAKDTGQSVDYMVDSIVTGLGRKSLMILDNLGLSAAEIKERMKETGDMTKAVGAIIRDEMAKAGDYVETAADRATKANVEVENAMTRLGETFQPLTDAANDMWTSIKVGALDLISKAVQPLIDKLTEAGRLRAQLNNINAGTGTEQTRAGKDLNTLKNAAQRYGGTDAKVEDLYNRQRARYIQQQNQAWRQSQAARQRYDQLRHDGGSQADLNAYYQRWQTMEAQAKAWANVLKEYDEGAKNIMKPVKADVDTTDAGNNVESLTKKLKELKKLRDEAINKKDFKARDTYNTQIKQTQDEIKLLRGGSTTTTTTHQTPQQRAQESFTKAEQNYKQALEQAALELQAGTITRAEAKKKEMQAAEARWKAIGDARNINDSENLRKAQDEAAAEYKRLAAEAKTATEHQKAVDKATRDLENANQKLAIARQEMAQARKHGDLQAYNTAKDKATAAQQEITRLEKVKVDVETGKVDLPKIPATTTTTVDFEANTRNIDAAISYVKKEMDTIPVGTIEFNLDQTKLVDLTTMKTLIDEQVKNGLEIDPEATQGLFSKIQLGVDIEDTTWQELIDKINEKLKELDIEPISINFKTGDTAKTGKETEKAWKNAASAVQSVGSALQQIEDPSAKIAGIIGQAVANIALGFAQATAASSGGGIFAWIAAITGGMATMISTISAIHSTTGYADGGVVKGNTYSGDQIPALVDGSQMVGLNAGEVVLNRSQQGVLAASLQAVGQSGEGGGDGKPYVSGEMIWLGLTNYLNRSGRGEIVTSKRR